MKAYLLVNFGGPRNLDEIPPFLTSLLTDRDVIRTNFPTFFHRLLFSRIAKKRAKKISPEYVGMGGKSPIYEDTEALALKLSPHLDGPLITFHRYLPETHQSFIEKISSLKVDEIRVLPLFPQFTYATTGSIARFFQKHLPWEVITRLRWIRSYPDRKEFIDPFVDIVKNTLRENGLTEDETFFLFSAHGIPRRYVLSGDLYEEECRRSYNEVMKAFPKTESLLAFQSQFGDEEWLRPYTKELALDVSPWIKGKKALLFLPISFTSDHIETLQEIGNGYLLETEKQGIKSLLLPAVGLHPDWIEGILKLFQEKDLLNNQMLIRREGCKGRCLGCRKVCRK